MALNGYRCMSLWLFTLSLLCFLTLSFAWYSFLPEASISLCKTTSRSNIPRGLLAMTSPKHFFTAAMEERLKRGVLTSGDLNRAFSFTKRDLDDFARKKYEGVVGVIFSLESVLVNLVPVMLYSFSILAEDLRKETPKEAQVRDILGMPFRDQLLALQWSVPKESEALVYTRFLQIFMRIADALPITPMPGAETLLDDLLRAGNEVTINSYLSREASIKAISKSGLSNVLEGRLGPDRLIFPSPDFPNTSQHRGQQLIRCCGVMRKPPTLTVSIDGNSRSILDAKRDGFGSIAIKGMAANVYSLRSADKICESLITLRPRDIYQLVERAVKSEEGPQQQTATDPVRDTLKLKSVSAPAQFENEKPRDTFAEEDDDADAM